MDDDLLASIVSFPSSPGISDTEYDKQARQLVKTLSETPAASLVTNDADGQDVWEVCTSRPVHLLRYPSTLLTGSSLSILQKTQLPTL